MFVSLEMMIFIACFNGSLIFELVLPNVVQSNELYCFSV